MTTHSETRIVPYTADLMYAVVAEVEKYPQFLPWVLDLRVLSREHVKGREVLMAEMSVGFSALRERYTSRVILDSSGRTVDVTQTEGPFRQLENHWRFTSQGTGCKIEFSIAFEFRSRLLHAIASAAFERVQVKMADAFEARAKALSQQSAQQT